MHHHEAGGPGALLIAALGLATLAVLGSCLAAARRTQPGQVRMAHLTMAAAMIPMLLTMAPAMIPVPLSPPVPVQGPVTALSLLALVTMAVLIGRRVEPPSTRLPCLGDLLGMAAVLALSALSNGTAIPVILAATCWSLTSLWLRRQGTMVVRWEGLSSAAAAFAMATMAVAMLPA